MRDLVEVLKESLAYDQASKTYSPVTDRTKIYIINRIMETGVDDVIGDQLLPNSGDDEFNEKIQNLRQAFDEVLFHLEKDGLIQINGYKIQKLRNI